MNVGTKVGLAVLVFAVTVVFAMFGSFASFNNSCVGYENGLKAQYEQNKNNYDNFYKKVKETAQVPTMYTKEFKELYTGVMQGRYGSEGSKATFQWIQEHNPNFDSSLYKQIQQVIESGRNDFQTNQKMFLDKKRVYETYVQVFPNNVFALILGFPKIKLSDYVIVTSDNTQEVFKTHKSEPIIIQ